MTLTKPPAVLVACNTYIDNNSNRMSTLYNSSLRIATRVP